MKNSNGEYEEVTKTEMLTTITTIGNYQFYELNNATKITIPNSVTSMGSFVFYACSKLTIYCEAKSKPSGWNSSWNLKDYDSNSYIYYSVIWNYKNNN